MKKGHRPPDRVAAFDDASIPLFRELTAAQTVVREALPRSASACLDLVAPRFVPTAQVAYQMRRAAQLLVSRALGTADTPSDARLTAANRDLANAVTFLAKRGPDAQQPTSSMPVLDVAPETLDRMAVAGLVREIGLELHDAAVFLKNDPEGMPALTWRPVTRQLAHADLLRRLYERAEVFADGNPLLDVEREAATWAFQCWSVDSAADPNRITRACALREQEWTFIDQRSMALGCSIMEAMAIDSELRELPRQLALARALTRSTVGVFVVVRNLNERVVLESLTAGGPFDVLEHDPEVDYVPGDLLFGRLIPYEGMHLRSPGCIFVRPKAGEPIRDLAERIAYLLTAFPPSLAIEGLATGLHSDERMPRNVDVGYSETEARDRLAKVLNLLDGSGVLAESITEPPMLGQPDGEDVQSIAPPLSPPSTWPNPMLPAWIRALSERAGLPGLPEVPYESPGAMPQPKDSGH